MIYIKILRIIPFVLLIIGVIVISVLKLNKVNYAKPVVPSTTNVALEQENYTVRAVWINYNELATNDNSKSHYEDKIESIFKTLKEKDYNTAFIQVRPFADAFYNSEFFPKTKYLCNGNVDFDALKIICEIAQKYNIEVHAWINPYRISYEPEYEPTTGMIKTASGTFYDPGNAKTSELILNGIQELITKYDISGIHIDDYFYPSDINEEDMETYTSTTSILTIEDWRRSNVNTLMKSIHELTKAKNLIFSISPSADIKKNYSSYFADVYSWCGNADYCDWIIPQIYFGFNNETMPFEATLNQWKSVKTNDNVKLIIGLPAYKQGLEDQFAGAGVNEFVDNSDVIAREIALVSSDSSCLGYAMYSYSSIA